MSQTADTETKAPEPEPRAGIDLNGEFHFKVDAKGRVALPAKFRKVLSKDLVVTRELQDECIYVFESPDFEQWINDLFISKFGKYNTSSKTHVNLKRKLKARAKDVEIDASGRIMLPADVREACGIGKDVVVIGNTGYFEIWDEERYRAVDESIDLGLFYSDTEA